MKRIARSAVSIVLALALMVGSADMSVLGSAFILNVNAVETQANDLTGEVRWDDADLIAEPVTGENGEFLGEEDAPEQGTSEQGTSEQGTLEQSVTEQDAAIQDVLE